MTTEPTPTDPKRAEPVPTGWRAWVAGARPRTLSAAVAPVIVGTAAAVGDADRLLVSRASLALVVALALQVGANYANDYSDGVRGTDRDRVGPLRLTASGAAAPRAVLGTAIAAFAIAAAAGSALAVIVTPWFFLVGAAGIAAAALYTGGPRPYGYEGLGELMVLIFFGFVATAGSAFAQLERVPASAWWGSVVIGLLTCAILLANNIRDVDADAQVGKRTLAVRLGAPRARRLYVGCVVVSFLGIVVIGVTKPAALLGLLAVPLAWHPVQLVRTRTDAPALIGALGATSRLVIVVAVLLGVGLCLS